MVSKSTDYESPSDPQPRTPRMDAEAASCQFEPAFRPPPNRELSVGVFGAGIAGLTAAHELARRGFTVTVYEPEADRRATLLFGRKLWHESNTAWRPIGGPPPVKLGGLAASQYATLEDPNAGALPDDAESADQLKRPLVGEHGFRFFPAYYLHIWDLLQQIPVYDFPAKIQIPAPQRAEDDVEFLRTVPRTSRTVFDNVVRTVTQGITTPDGQPSIVVPREAPRTLAEYISTLYAARNTGFQSGDMLTFIGRVMRYLVTTPERRFVDFENVSAYEFLVGSRTNGEPDDFHYEKRFRDQMRQMPRVLAAYDSMWGDARTIMTTWCQLNLMLDRHDSKGDGVLNGPTTEAWFDHWHTYLATDLGVTFQHCALDTFDFRYLHPGNAAAARTPEEEDAREKLKAAFGDAGNGIEREHKWADPGKKPVRFGLRSSIGLGGLLAFTREVGAKGQPTGDPTPTYHDYYVLATSPQVAHQALEPVRLDSAESIRRLKSFVMHRPDERRPVNGVKRGERTSAFGLDDLGEEPWDRFQTLSGIQLFFDVPLQIVRGHVYYNASPWALSSICQQVHWEHKPTANVDGYATVMSVDIGDWNRPVDIDGEQLSAKDLLKTAKGAGANAAKEAGAKLAAQVWEQIAAELDLHFVDTAGDVLPKPKWYMIDQHLDLEEYQNKAPYLVPIVGDFKRRPSTYPFNPHGETATWRKRVPKLGEPAASWQAPHAGYEVHHGCLVLAGTYTKTFTRITSMEAACESGRHAVNAILDHLLELDHQADFRDDVDRRYDEGLIDDKQAEYQSYRPRHQDPVQWRSPYDWVDQSFSAPTRQPTARGDYCFIVDPENREDGEYRPARHLDLGFFSNGKDHPWRGLGLDLLASHQSYSSSYAGPYQLLPLLGTYAPIGLLTDTLRAQSALWQPTTLRSHDA